MDENNLAEIKTNSVKLGYLEKRLDALEEQTKSINSIAISVEKLAMSMESMLKEQTEQGERLKKLEDEPAEKWNTLHTTLFTAIVSTIGGGFAAALVSLIAQFIK